MLRGKYTYNYLSNKNKIGEYYIDIDICDKTGIIRFDVMLCLLKTSISHSLIFDVYDFKINTISAKQKHGHQIKNEFTINSNGSKYYTNDGNALYFNGACFHTNQALFMLPELLTHTNQNISRRVIINLIPDSLSGIETIAFLKNNQHSELLTYDCIYPTQYYSQYNHDSLLEYCCNKLNNNEVVRS